MSVKKEPRSKKLDLSQEIGFVPPRVVVKFRDEVKIPYQDGAEKVIERAKIGPWSRLVAEFKGITMKRLYPEIGAEKIIDLVRRASELDETYRPPNLLNYFVIDTPPDLDPQSIAKVLSTWDSVEIAYVEGGPTPPPAVNASDDPRWPAQGYLDPAPSGIDAEFAWTVLGGDGTGQSFVDLERGWTLNHEDLIGAGISLISGVNQDYFGHGTAVLGEIRAVDNAIGDVGIVSQASGRVVSQWRTSSTYNTAEAILSAASVMSFGDVLLLEAQTIYAGLVNLPVEVELAVFDAIRLTTALGIVVVEAAGNGGNDLDTFSDPVRGRVLDRSSSAFRDSGAIMVGAASASVPHTRLWFSCFGSRIDCYGWGESIDTTGDGWTGNLMTTYTATFGGTSGASPIITGAALSVQGMNQASRGYRFSPRQIRTILSNPNTGTQSSNPAADKIGVMPDLKKIANNVLGVIPDVYVRDFVGDVGSSHSGAISTSPDVILRPNSVTNPQGFYGSGSGTENDMNLGFEAEFGQDNFVYVRALNRGGATASNVQATVYWSEVATLLTPDTWNVIGTVSLPNVPMGDVLTVAPALTWPAGQIPAPGHYCFVCLMDAVNDPAPGPAAFTNWSNFETFVRNNNNVTWRNFNVVNNVPPSGTNPPGFISLPFVLPGALDETLIFEVAVEARLPDKARVMLEVPRYLADALKEHVKVIKSDGKNDTALLAIRAQGIERLGELRLAAKSRAACRLLVEIPKGFQKHEYQIAVRQVFKDLEVGRVTWRLTPQTTKDRLEAEKKRK